MKISYSRFESYHRCPYKHFLSYYECLVSKYKERPLSFGSDMHKLLEHRHHPEALAQAKVEIGDEFYALSQAQQARLGGEDYIQDLSVIFSDYRKLYKKERVPTFSERKFKIKACTYRDEPIIFTGIIDEGCIYREDGEKVVDLGEHKTFKRKPDANTLVMNTQKNLYAKAYYLKSGILPRRVIWDHICSTPAAEPIYLEKSNRFSQAASKTITPYSYRRACKLHGIEDPAILAKAKQYKSNISEFFYRTPMDIVPEQVDIVWDGFMYTAKDIVRQGHKNKTRYLTRDCSWCDFRDICNAELSGYSAKDIIKRNFTYRERED